MFIKLLFRIKKRNIIIINNVNIDKVNINFILKLILIIVIVKILFNKFDLINFYCACFVNLTSNEHRMNIE